MWKWLSSLFVGIAGGAIARFPFAVLCLLAATIVANLDIARSSLIAHDFSERFLLSAAGAAILSVALALTCETRSIKSLGASLLAVAISAAYGLLIWFNHAGSETDYTFIILPVLLALLLPNLRPNGAEQLWALLLGAIRAATTGFVVVLAFVSSAVLLVELFLLLFNLQSGSRQYLHVYATAFMFFGPLITLGLLPADKPFTEELGRLRQVVRQLLVWGAIPMVLAILLVLHLYALRVLIVRETVAEEMLWIVPGALFGLLTVRILAFPFSPAEMPRVYRWFGKLWPLLVCVPLLLFALAWRAEETPRYSAFQYYNLMICLVAVLAAALHLVPMFRRDIRQIVAISALTLALSLWGPWGVAAFVEKGRQMRASWSAASVDTAERIFYRSPAAPAIAAEDFDLIFPQVSIDVAEQDFGSGYSGFFSGTDLMIRFRDQTVRFDASQIVQAARTGPDAVVRGSLQSGSGQKLGYALVFINIVDGVPRHGVATLLLRSGDWHQ